MQFKAQVETVVIQPLSSTAWSSVKALYFNKGRCGSHMYISYCSFVQTRSVSLFFSLYFCNSQTRAACLHPELTSSCSIPRYKSSIFTVWQPRKSSYFWQASAWKAPAKKRNEIFLINVFFFFKSWQKNLSDFNAWQKFVQPRGRTTAPLKIS